MTEPVSDTADNHRVSVIIPAFNAESFVGEAITSVIEQHCDAEIIVVDDGSTDTTAAVAARFGDAVYLIRSPQNEGLPSALNRGLRSATGSLIGFLDADDLWEPGRLRVDVALIEQENVSILWGQTRITFLDSADGVGRTSAEWPPRHYPSLGAMLFRRELFERIGYFDPEKRHAQDIDLLARANEAGTTIHRHDRIVLNWRRHARNMTNNIRLDRDYFITAVRDALIRRREGNAG